MAIKSWPCMVTAKGLYIGLAWGRHCHSKMVGVNIGSGMITAKQKTGWNGHGKGINIEHAEDTAKKDGVNMGPIMVTTRKRYKQGDLLGHVKKTV